MNSPTAEHVVDALVAARLVDPDHRQDSIGVVAGVLTAPSPVTTVGATGRRSLPQLVEVVAYLGGALVLAAGGLFLAQEWGDLGFASRVTMLAVVAAVLAAAGAVASRVPSGGPSLRDELNDSRRRLAGTLLTGAALSVGFLVGMVVDENFGSGTGDVYWPAVAGAGLGVLVGAVGYRIAPTAVGLLGLMGGVITTVMNGLGVIEVGNEGDVIAVALLVIAAVWLGLTEAGWFRETTVARSLGVSVAGVGAQVPVMEGSHSWFGYLLTVAVAVAGIAIYLGKVAWPYLTAAVISVTLVVPEAVSDWTDDSFGAIGGVLVTGVTLLVASFAGYRLRAEAVD